MPTNFGTRNVGDTIAAAHVNDLQDAVNDLEDGSALYFAAAGSSNAYTGTLSPAVSSLTAGFAVKMLANHDNTGAATLNLNSIGATGIKKTDGATALAAGDLQNGQIYPLVYDGTYWQLVGGGGATQTVSPGTFNARLTLTSGTAVTTADVTGASTIYLTPYLGNTIALYSGTVWSYYTLTEISLGLSSLTSGKNYDVFCYDNSGTPTLVLSSAWTNDTTRADALAVQDGVRVLNSDKTRRLVGTIRTTGTTTTEDSVLQRFCLNEAHRVRRLMFSYESGSWTYNSNAYRVANNNAANIIKFLCHADDVHDVTSSLATTAGATPRQCSVALDANNAEHAYVLGMIITGGTSTTEAFHANTQFCASNGYHYCHPLERATASGTYTAVGAGVRGVIWA